MVTINLAEYCGASHSRNVEILACKIFQHKDEKILLDLHVEGWDIVENGIEQVVKNICDAFWHTDIKYANFELRDIYIYHGNYSYFSYFSYFCFVDCSL